MDAATADRAAGRPAAVYGACAASLALGLLFIFVRAPHPWGWEGFDHYHDIALELARGHAFPTMEYPWGYAYFLAAFYRLFGDHQWIPLALQAVVNALVPRLVFDVASAWVDRRTATLAAILTGVFSFNTVYASTQSSDAVCTFLFMAAIAVFVAARRADDWKLFALAGVLTGLAPQFRPNLILVPLLLAAFAFVERRTRARALGGALLVAGAALVLMPWVLRNYRLTRSILPTSVHGGVQLWYGTLQTGPYLNSRAHNPRSVFEAPVFDYTSLDSMPVLVRASIMDCATGRPSAIDLRYWTDADPTVRPVPAHSADAAARSYAFEIPATNRSATIYYYFATRWDAGENGIVEVATPPYGARAPFLYFISQNHLGDLDASGDLLDIFDVVRLARHEAWGEPLPFADRLREAGVGDVRSALERLADRRAGGRTEVPAVLVRFDHDDHRARLTLADGSTIGIPRQWSDRITDLEIWGELAANLTTARRSLAALGLDRTDSRNVPGPRCTRLEDVVVNREFYRWEPHMMRRYSALAFDNIRRDPFGFLFASAYRAVRLFVIAGTTDSRTAQQFAGSRLVYAAATAISIVYLVLLAAGVTIAYRRGDALWLPLLLVLYVPATIAPVLTNMRYTVTVQPLIFMFIAVAVTRLADRAGRAGGRAAGDPEGMRTAPRP